MKMFRGEGKNYYAVNNKTAHIYKFNFVGFKCFICNCLLLSKPCDDETHL